MARKKNEPPKPVSEAFIIDTGISTVLETNFMPYAMSVIISRAIPEIDGFKPSQRKILYTMYRMGLMTSPLAKSARVAGQTMMFNPHGDAANYDTMVRLTTGKESLLHPFVESKGSFGKHYSDMPCAASRYTEVRLAKFCEEIFGGIDKDAVDFVPNFDNTDTEPVILPVSFPNVLVSPNIGIAVGMASNICSFNLGELCDATIKYLSDGDISTDDLLDILKAPDFSTGGLILYDREKFKEIYETGKGSFKIRSKYCYNPKDNCIEITEIPYTTTVEKIKDAIVALVKKGAVRDITDVRDEIDINGLKLTIDLKKGASYEKIMAKLIKSTQIEDTFACNFNILVGGSPKLMGVVEILEEWTAFRIECLRRQFTFDLFKNQDKLHLLYGLKEILLDIDKAIKIVRGTEKDADVVPNLMKGFNIDKIQAEYVADIKLRNLNKEYILKRIDDIGALEDEIKRHNDLIDNPKKIKSFISKQLKQIKDKYAIPRKTLFLEQEESALNGEDEAVEDYPVVAFVTKEGYFKKCTPASLRGNDVQKLKESDSILWRQETSNAAELIVFTSCSQVYKTKLSAFDEVKASALGDYLPAVLSFDEGEKVIAAFCVKSYDGGFILFFANGKGVRIPADVYKTKNNRKKLTNAFASQSPVVAVYPTSTAAEYLVVSTAKKALLVKETQIVEKSTRTSVGAQLINMKTNQQIEFAVPYYPEQKKLIKESKYRKSVLPAAGILFEDFDISIGQQTLFNG